MKEKIVILLLTLGLVSGVLGCAKDEELVPEILPISQMEEKAEESAGAVESSPESSYPEQGRAENSEGSVYDLSVVDAYMTALEEKAEEIEEFLEHDAMTQLDMNEKTQELYELWDEALNYLWKEIKSQLSDSEFAKLLEEQREWITEKESAVKAAGKEFEGGSMYALAVNAEAAEITQERVYELYEVLTKLP